MKVITKSDYTRKAKESYVASKARSEVKIEKQDVQNYDTVNVEQTMTKNKTLAVAIMYRLPKQQPNDDTALYKEIQSTIRNKSAIIVGDF